MSIDEVIEDALFDYCKARCERECATQDRIECDLRATIEMYVAEAVARERVTVLDEVLRGLRSERDTDQLRAIIAEVEAIRARGTT